MPTIKHGLFFNKTDFLLLFIKNELKPIRCFSGYFPVFPKVGKLMSDSLKRKLAFKYPDAFAEGYTWLFKK